MSGTRKHRRSSSHYSNRRISEKRRAYLSARAKRQNRNPDGSFAKGFKKSNSRIVRMPKVRIIHAGLPHHNSNAGRKRNTVIGKQNTDISEKRTKIDSISVKGTVEETKTIEKQIESNFTKEELKTVSRNGILIEVKDLPKNKAGEYLYEKDEQGREHILLDDDAVDDNETATHEMVHLCRNMDPEREGFDKSLIETVNGKPKVKNENVPLEEALTVSETIARTDTELTKNQLGYYTGIAEADVERAKTKPDFSEKEKSEKEKTPEDLALEYKQHDAELIKGNGKKKLLGKDAYESINKIFPKLKISRLTNNESVAISRFAKLRRKFGGKP